MGTHFARLGGRLAAAALLLCAALPAGAQNTDRVLALVNQHRADAGLVPLVRVGELDAAALRHSKDMAAHNFMDHTGTDGSNAGVRITDAGYDWRSYGENVAAGFSTPESVVLAWMQSPGHRANILGSGFRHLGVSVVYSPTTRYGYYWTLDLASGTPLSPPPPPGGANPPPGGETPPPGGDTPPGEEMVSPPPPTLPSITLVSPASGRVGTTVTLQGARFGTTRGTVRFNGATAAIRSWSSTRIQVTVPTGATTGLLSVTTALGTTLGPPFQVTLPTTSVSISPRLVSLSLQPGPSGMLLALTGENLGATQGLSRVYVRRTTSPVASAVTIVEWSATRVVARPGTIPRGSYDVYVRRADGRASNTLRFTIP